MKRRELLELGEVVVWILVTAAKAFAAPHALTSSSADSAANEFQRRFPSNRDEAA